MSKKTAKVVTLRSKSDRKKAKKLADEPEMKELKRMIQDGELDRDRTLDHLKREADKEEALSKTPGEKESDQKGRPAGEEQDGKKESLNHPLE